ncbi:MAG TPA: hypothetical protein VK585_18125, partial [Jiangellaceae bacterium]|nr:hypothetical protein [Jiangellaceae bacterium]
GETSRSPTTAVTAATAGPSGAPLKVTGVAAGLLFPHAAQAVQIVRRRRPLGAKKWSTQTVYAITSLSPAQASPAYLAEITRGHWTIGRVAPALCGAGAPSEPGERAFPAPRLKQARRRRG